MRVYRSKKSKLFLESQLWSFGKGILKEILFLDHALTLQRQRDKALKPVWLFRRLFIAHFFSKFESTKSSRTTSTLFKTIHTIDISYHFLQYKAHVYRHSISIHFVLEYWEITRDFFFLFSSLCSQTWQ